jgi:RNA polymerase II subunit A small phosphatase-like protein
MKTTQMIRRTLKRAFFSGWRGKKPADQKPSGFEETSYEQLNPLVQTLKLETESRRAPLPDKTNDLLTVFLELDGVLFNVYTPHISEGFFTKPAKMVDFYFDLMTEDERYSIFIYLRPHYKEFLEYLRKNTETVLYTCSENVFMERILEGIGKEHFNFIEHKLYQEECGRIKSDEDNLDELSKVISGLNRDLKRSLLIDSRPLSFLSEPNNALPISEYLAAEDEYDDDDQLLRMIEVLESLKKVPDVRFQLRDKLKIEDTLKEINFN